MTAEGCDAGKVLDRIIVQVYNTKMYEVLKGVYLHTVNDVPLARELLEKGSREIYSDEICPKELEE